MTSFIKDINFVKLALFLNLHLTKICFRLPHPRPTPLTKIVPQTLENDVYVNLNVLFFNVFSYNIQIIRANVI